VARRKLTLTLDGIVTEVTRAVDDEAAVAVLDAAAARIRATGMARWTVDDVADDAGVGRTSVYRWFGSREDLVHAVLARELRETLLAVGAAAVAARSFEDAAVEAALVCLDALDGSLVDHLLRTDPDLVLPLLTTGAGPLLALARSALAPGVLAAGVTDDPTHAAIVAEALARLGLSLVLTRDTVAPLDDAAALRAAVRALVAPLVRATPGSGDAG
jgi:AcrR family transcriptional regulator